MLRERFIARARGLNVNRLVFVDEAGATTSMTRDHGRGPRGTRVHGRVPRNRGTVTTMIGAMSVDGVEAMMTIEGGTSGEVFLAYVTEVLVPRLCPDDIVILDNAGAHKVKGVRDAIEAAGAWLWYLPPYSPDLNPIELCWSKLKGVLKDLGARTAEALELSIGEAMRAITPENARAFFRHCGFQNQCV